MQINNTKTVEYTLHEREAALYARMPLKLLKAAPVPYLQYQPKLPRFYRKADLDEYVQQHIHQPSEQAA